VKHAPIFHEDPRAARAIQRYSDLRTERMRHETDWNDIARLMRPQRGGFGVDSPTMRQMTKALSSDPIQAHSNFAAGIYSSITNPATQWGGLTTPDPDLNQWPPFAAWLDRTAARIHQSFSPSMSGFYSASYQIYADLAAFGNGAAYDDLDEGTRKFRDVTVSLAEVVCDIDFHGRVVEWVRKTYLTPGQALREFGHLPSSMMDKAEKGSIEKYAFFHHVLPNDDFLPNKIGVRGKRFISRWCCEEGNTLLREGGYADMPFYYPRWDVDTGMIYGIGPGYIALPSARVHEQMEQATLRAAQRAADPARLAPDRDSWPLNGTFRPGSVIYGAMSPNGTPMVRTEDFNGNIGLTMEEKRAHAEAVKSAFYYSVMSLTGRTGLSNDENRVIEEARLRNWAPHADRIMEEYAARKFERRFALLLRAGQIDPVPEGVPSGIPLQVQYTSAAAMALRASQANYVRTFLSDIAGISQIKPEILDRLSADDVAEILHDANPSLPQRLLVTREQAIQMREARAQQAQQQAQMQALQQGSAAARDASQAGQNMAAMDAAAGGAM
jgi:hypothetical protein